MPSDYQVSFGGFLIGDETDYDVVEVAGLEAWSVRENDVTRPTGWGDIPLAAYATAKTITVTIECAADGALLRALEQAFVPAPLHDPASLVQTVFKFPDRSEWQLDTRCARRARVRNLQNELGLTTTVVQLQAPDPRLYSTTLSAESVSSFVSEGGAFELTVGSGADLAVDLTVGSGVDLALDLSAVVGSGLVAIVNAGTVDTFPVVSFTASAGMSAFTLTNQTTGEVASFQQYVGPGETLLVDMTPGAVSPVTLGGAGRYTSWVSPRVPLRIAPGTNVFRFDVSSGVATGAAALVQWRSAEI